MKRPLGSRGYAALSVLLALVASTVLAGHPCPPKPPTVPSGPVILKNGVLKITPIVDALTKITVQKAAKQVVVLYNSATYTFDACKVRRVEVDASDTTADAEAKVSMETGVFLKYTGGAGAGSIVLANGDADIFGGAGDLSATLGDGKVFVECGEGTSYVTAGTGLLLLIGDDVGTLFFGQETAGYSLIETGSGDSFITATAGEGAVFVTDPLPAFLDVTGDYCVVYDELPCWVEWLFWICW